MEVSEENIYIVTYVRVPISDPCPANCLWLAFSSIYRSNGIKTILWTGEYFLLQLLINRLLVSKSQLSTLLGPS